MHTHKARWASRALVLGGLLMAGLWLVYTRVHGPTSYDETNALAGRSTLFWGMLLGGPPPLLVALGLGLERGRLTAGLGRRARIGHALTVFGLAVAASIDLIIGALGPPFFGPVVGLGLLLLAAGRLSGAAPPRTATNLLLALGLLQWAAFAAALIPNAVADEWGGYRVYGVLAHLLPGLLWAALGVTAWAPAPASVAEGPA